MPEYEDSAGIGSTGEGSLFGSDQESAEFFFTPIPDVDPTRSPGKTPREEEGRYTPGSGSSSSGTLIAGDRTFVGLDAFGNPIYTFTPERVARAYYDLNPGWNTRASIPEPIGPTMYLSYQSGMAVGAIVGLTDQPETTAGYEDIILGWMTLKGVAYILSHGQVLLEVPVATTLPDPGKYNRDVDALVMKKTLNKVEFFLASPTGQSGETKISEAFMTEEVTYVSAALYLGGDSINNEILEYPDVVAAEIPAVRLGFYESGSESYLTSTIPAITASFYEEDYSVLAAEISAVGAFFGDFDSAFFNAELAPITCSFNSTLDADIGPDFNYFFTDIPPVATAFIGRDMTFGTLQAVAPAVTGFFADQNASVLRATIPAVRCGFYEAEFPDRFTFVSFAYMAARMASRPTAYLVLNSSAQVVAAFTLTEIQHMLLDSEIEAGNTSTLTAIIYQLLTSTMSAGDVAALQRDGMSVWSLNMDVMGSTRYEGFDFNSFMTIDGQTYGVNATGIHKIEGTTDDGAAINQTVDFGSLSFGTNARKALPYVYVGMASDGKTVLKVESDGSTYYYTARDATELMKTHRFELGRGLRSTFYNISLTSEGELFDLHNIDFQPVELKRSL